MMAVRRGEATMLPVLIPEYFCLVSGVGVHEEDKVAQDLAGHEAGIHDLNIVKVTSVLASGCKERQIDCIRKESRPGQIILAVDGKCLTSIEGQIVSAGLAVTIPDDPNLPGFFSEIYEHPGILPEHLKRRVEKGSLQIFANNVGDQEFDPDRSWEDGKTRYQIGGTAVTLTSIVASGVGQGKGKYTLAYVGALFL
jgi:pyruvoyl-dependent arginine decarboxylase